MRYAILAFDSENLGLHGIYSTDIIEASCLDAAFDCGAEMGEDVIDCFGVRDEAEEDGYEVEITPEYEVYEIRSDCEVPTEVLRKELAEEGVDTDFTPYITEDFIKKYCKEDRYGT